MNGRCIFSVLMLHCVLVGTITAAPVILNEFNAVSSGNYLDGGDYSDRPERGDPFFATFTG